MRPVYTTSVLRRLVDVFSLPLALLSSVLWVYGQDSQRSGSGSVQDAAANLSRMHEAWGAKASTPNASLTIKESGRSGQVIKFRLYAGGVPKAAVYSIVAWPVTQKGPSEVLKGVTLDESGLAICAGASGTCGSADKPNDPIDLNLTAIPGEPVRLGLVSADGATKVRVSATAESTWNVCLPASERRRKSRLPIPSRPHRHSPHILLSAGPQLQTPEHH
jgi:hypothetical protein